MAVSVTGIKDNMVASQNAALVETAATASASMKGAFIKSGILHALIVAASLIGIPFLAKEEPLLITPVSIELVDIAELTQTTKVAPPKKQEKPKEIEKPQKPEPPPKPVEAAPKVVSESPPKLEEIKPEPIVEAKKEKPKPKPKPQEKPKEKPKPKPEVQKPKEDAFDSLLKNLAPDAESQKPQEKTLDETLEDVLEDTSSGQIARLSDQLTISELDAFRYQLEPCWNVPAGAKYAENLAVEIRVSMNRDGSVNKSSVLDKGRYNRDSAFRAAADSALRALRNPRCSPLNLPPEKYQQWKSIVINFDPRNML